MNNLLVFVPDALPAEGPVTNGALEVLAALVDALHVELQTYLLLEIRLTDAAFERPQIFVNRSDMSRQDALPAEDLVAIPVLG